MTTQKSVGVTIGEESSHSSSQASGSSSQNTSSRAANQSATIPSHSTTQPATQPSQATSQHTTRPTKAPTPTQIPNRALLVSGTKLPQLPVFNAVSTGSLASDRRATTVVPQSRPVKTTQTLAGVPWGRLPQTGEVGVSFSVFLGVVMLVALGLRAYRARRHQ